MNLAHRLDRGASGCVLVTLASYDPPAPASGGGEGEADGELGEEGYDDDLETEQSNTPRSTSWTHSVRLALQAGEKTYVALCRGDGSYLEHLAQGRANDYQGLDGKTYPIQRLYVLLLLLLLLLLLFSVLDVRQKGSSVWRLEPFWNALLDYADVLKSVTSYI